MLTQVQIIDLAFAGIQAERHTSRTTCPYCSAHRRKRREKCLALHVHGQRVEWVCHHCGWEGAT
jgi:transposase-like protein